MSDLTERATGLLTRSREAMAQELSRLRREAARIEADHSRRLKQAEWLGLWCYDASRDVFTTDRGDMLSGFVVRADGSSWPFIEAWYNAYPEERSRV